MDLELQVYQRAQARIVELTGELSRLQTFVAMYDELAGQVGAAREVGTACREYPGCEVEETAERGNDTEADHGMLPLKATPQPELERIVVQVITTHGAPLQRMDLYERVKAIGVVVGGQKELINFGSKLSRAESLVNLPKLGYWPKDRPYEAGGYIPKSEEPPTPSDGA